MENCGIDVPEYSRKTQLLIIDALDVYSNKEEDIVDLIEQFALYARRNGKGRVVIIGDLGAFRIIQKIDRLIS